MNIKLPIVSDISVQFSHSVMSDFCATPWTVAHQTPLSMEFSRQEYRSGVPLPSPGYLSNPGIEPRSPALQADSLLSESPGKLMRGEQDRKQVRGKSRRKL